MLLSTLPWTVPPQHSRLAPMSATPRFKAPALQRLFGVPGKSACRAGARARGSGHRSRCSPAPRPCDAGARMRWRRAESRLHSSSLLTQIRPLQASRSEGVRAATNGSATEAQQQGRIGESPRNASPAPHPQAHDALRSQRPGCQAAGVGAGHPSLPGACLSLLCFLLPQRIQLLRR